MKRIFQSTLMAIAAIFLIAGVPMGFRDPGYHAKDNVVRVKVGSFTTSGSTGNQSITGVGFKPKALITFCSDATVDGFYATGFNLGLGFSDRDPANARIIGNSSIDALLQRGAYFSKASTNNIVYIGGNNGLPLGGASLTSIDSDGFSINVSLARARRTGFVALGGDSLLVVTTNIQTGTSSGAFSVTGIGFKPAAIILMGVIAQTSNVSTNSSDLFGKVVGFASGPAATNQCSMFYFSGNTNPSDMRSLQWTNTVYTIGPTTTRLTLTSFDADGFTGSWSAAPAASYNVQLICLRGGQYSAGIETQPTSASDKSTTGLGFQPIGLLLAGWNHIASTSIDTTQARTTFGACDNRNGASMWGQRQDNSATPDSNGRYSSTNAFFHASNTATLDAAANIKLFDVNGFTLNWPTADATAREFFFLGIAPQ